MKPQQFEAELLKTLSDGRLSRTEKRALRELVATTKPSALPKLRALAFDVACGELGDSEHVRRVLDWLDDVTKVLLGDDALEPPPSSGAFFSPGDEPMRKIVGLLSAVRSSCDICVFTITDDRIAEAILACHRRGMRVRVITDNDKAYDRGSDVDRIKAAGVPLRVDLTEHHMHHKFALFDRELLLTGSYNWTRSAGAYNHENVVVTADRRLTDAFNKVFDELWETLG